MTAPTFDVIQAPLRDIYIVGERRPANDEDVHRLAQSIQSIGLRTPITVREAEVTDPEDGEVLMAFALVVGRHRLEAYRSLGHTHIPAIVRECTVAEAELWEIDENLCRAELSPSDRARQTARRKAIYEELHPDTRAGVAGALAKHRAVDSGAVPPSDDATANLATASFAEATASATGSSKRAVRRDAERGERVLLEVLEMIRGTKLDTGAYLDKLKKLPPNEQVQAAKRDLAIDRKRERTEQQAEPNRQLGDPLSPFAPRQKPAPAAAPAGPSAFDRFITLSDGFSDLQAANVIASIPSPSRRADLRNRVRSLLAFLEAVDDLMEGSNRA